MIRLYSESKNLSSDVSLPRSKSISNRVLIIQALAKGIKINNLSDANDTQLLFQLLNQDEPVYDCEDAGTTFRFLLSYLALKNVTCTLTGSKRMCERPISHLVFALNKLGFCIEYLGERGFPPLKINAIKNLNLIKKKVEISVDKSSQFLTSLLLISPYLKKGLTINIQTKIASKSYVDMTISLMRYFGIRIVRREGQYQVSKQLYQPKLFGIEADWSNASYFYSLLLLSESSSLFINNLKDKSIQGDRVIVEIMKKFGINTVFMEEGVLLSKNHSDITEFEYDFSDCPDLAQTVIFVCAVRGIKSKFMGLASLRIKETDRIFALQSELEKIGKTLKEYKRTYLYLDSDKAKIPEELVIKTYKDHRMAMTFAPLVMKCRLTFDDEKVVKKSFPNFWVELKKQNISCEIIK